MSNPDDDYVTVVRHILVKGRRADVEGQLARCWLQPGSARETAKVTQQEIYRAPPEALDAEDQRRMEAQQRCDLDHDALRRELLDKGLRGECPDCSLRLR